MERIPDRPEPDPEEPEHPSGTEVDPEPPGVDPEESEGEQPGLADEPPQAD